jgi:amidophosphoribosyltransferase
VTGDVDAAYLNRIESARSDFNKTQRPPNSSTQLDLNLLSTDTVYVD